MIKCEYQKHDFGEKNKQLIKLDIPFYVYIAVPDNSQQKCIVGRYIHLKCLVMALLVSTHNIFFMEKYEKYQYFVVDMVSSRAMSKEICFRTMNFITKPLSFTGLPMLMYGKYVVVSTMSDISFTVCSISNCQTNSDTDCTETNKITFQHL